MELKRSSGILLHPTSLPGRFNIGDFGPSAREFIDRLSEARQSWWQVLPLTPPGYGGSPYGSSSSFSISLAMVDPLWLLRKGWISDEQLEQYVAHEPTEGDLGAFLVAKENLLNQAFNNLFEDKPTFFTENEIEGEPEVDLEQIVAQLESFKNTNLIWLPDDALFFALKKKFNHSPWNSWPEPMIQRDDGALEKERESLKTEISQYVFAQWVAHRQWSELRDYAHSRSIQLIGDIPIFVAMDSSDVWAHRDVFKVNQHGECDVVAGVPPDYFSKTGQKWGNPLYRWDDEFDTVMDWWVERVRRTCNLVDLVRIDHFRAFVDYWEVPINAPTAETGTWKAGPGDRFFKHLRECLGEVPFIAEDLGMVSDDVYALRDRQNLPGMKIIEFAFDGNPEHPFLPHTYPELCVAYPGTHDNNTIVGWIKEDATDSELHEARLYLTSSNKDLPRKMIESLFDSYAKLAIIQLQDLFELPASARMNTPGKPDGNWIWRMSHDMLNMTVEKTKKAWEWLHDITDESERSS